MVKTAAILSSRHASANATLKQYFANRVAQEKVE
jgi:hypothetical protein